LNPIFACTRSIEDWRNFLARPDRHWRVGYSAHSLATSWQEANGFPAEIFRVLATDPELEGIQPLIGVPEYRVPLPGGSRASQSDILILGGASAGAFSMVVEGKVAESFGPLVNRWLSGASPGKLLRWAFITQLLEVSGRPCGHLRYQLFHRAASAVLAARLHHSPFAILVIHSVSAGRVGFADYSAFLQLFGVTAVEDAVHSVGEFCGRRLLAAWVNGLPSF
jgi:hypothetical protein